MSYLACEAHGRMLLRDDGSWECAGFDGEGIGWCTAGPVPPTAAARLFAGVTYWPGVLVLDEAGQVTGMQRKLQPGTARMRELVNAALRRDPVA